MPHNSVRTEILQSRQKIATNILENRLQLLEENGIITRSPYPDNKVKGFYQLSAKGIDLIPALIEIGLWGEKYLSGATESSTFFRDVKKNKAKFVSAITVKLLTKDDAPN